MRVERVMLVRVRKAAFIGKIRHEGTALGGTSWETATLSIEQFSPDRRLPSVISSVADARQRDAMSVAEGVGADAARPAGIVPRNADRDVLSRQPASAFDHKPEPPRDTATVASAAPAF
jgi:hypothetical protein